MYLYIKAFHIIFIVTWFAGLFYLPRLLIYNREAIDLPAAARQILRDQYDLMIKRLWYIITWPSAILTLLLGSSTWYLYGSFPSWLKVKLFFVALLYCYHFSLHLMVRQQLRGEFRQTSQFLRVWNEVSTILLVAIVLLVEVKQNISLVWGLSSLIGLMAVLMVAIKLYQYARQKKK